MLSNSFRSLSGTLAVLLLSGLRAHATLFGYSPDPAGTSWDRGDANTGFALFERYPSWQFPATAPAAPVSNLPADRTSFGITSPTWAQSTAFTSGAQGGGLYDKLQSVPVADRTNTFAGTNGDLLFGGGNSVSFTLAGNVSFPIRGVVLQVKRNFSNATLADVNGFAPTLNIAGLGSFTPDGTSLAFGSGDSASDDTGNYSVTSYYWNASLAGNGLSGTNAFTITAIKTGLQRGIDGFQVDVGNVSVVPEPATSGLLVCGAAILARRRRSPADAAV